MRLGAILLAVALVVNTAPAWAGAPLVNLPYSNALEHQQWLWGRADSVVVVRLVEIHKSDPTLSQAELRERRLSGVRSMRVTLEPVSWLKGEGSPLPFGMPSGGTGDCIPTSGWDSLSAKVGDTFVAYFWEGPLSGETLAAGFVPEAIVEENAVAAMMKAPE